MGQEDVLLLERAIPECKTPGHEETQRGEELDKKMLVKF